MPGTERGPGGKEAEEGVLTFQQLPGSLASSVAHRLLSHEDVFKLLWRQLPRLPKITCRQNLYSYRSLLAPGWA